jgi:hypothetical protein
LIRVVNLAEYSFHVTFSNQKNIGLAAFTLSVERRDDKPETFPWAEVTEVTMQVENAVEEKKEARN